MENNNKSNGVNCLFCNIAKGKESSSKIYEDKNTYAFLDINPTNKGHTLVIPKKHFYNFYDLPDKEMCQMMLTAKKLAAVIKKAMNADGINIIMNNDRAAGQLISHSHVHIVPRFDNDGFRHWKGTPYQTSEMEQVAEQIQKEL